MSVYTMANLRNVVIPKGKYNGRPIVGAGIKISLNFTFWHVSCSWNFGEPYFLFGPIHVRGFLVYG